MQTQEVTKVVIDEKFIIDAVNEKLAKANLKTVKPYNVSTDTRLEGYGPGEHEASYIPDAIVECTKTN